MTDIAALGAKHGREYAEDSWQVDPADYDMAIQWCEAADNGTLAATYPIPEAAADAIPCDLDTAGWSWGEQVDYQVAWDHGFYERATELCRDVIAREVTA